ncbi:hypothetical protein A3F57_03775 [Candidatus Roizmanbacteria bacterium RIFCSPHIGHO2_12_FULL_36_11]|nr:MAG: hypothetical protein A3F57_03775 [Candidatus Roizmanbacteria bacterium RIFCSPHIGHO2_12_FULL_36_11]
MKKFVYLVQSEGKLNSRLEVIYGLNSDIILLTWKKPTKEAIFFPLSTWTEGRNRLYQEVFLTNYLYYIFLDGDVDLRVAHPHKKTNKNPWRVLESYLLKFLPAVGVPRFSWDKTPYKEVKAVYYFDAPINAIHKEALNVLLPFYDGDDMESWWNSGIYFLHLASLLYRHHVFQFDAVEAVNKTHRPYPRHYDWKKVDNKFKASILSERLASNFQSHYPFRQSSNGRVKKKNIRYAYPKEKLSNFFDFDNQIFKRRLFIQKNIKDKEPYAVCGRSKLPYLGEFVCKKMGIEIATFMLNPLLIFYELKKRYLLLFGVLKRNIYNIIGVFQKKTSSLRHWLGLKNKMKEETPIEKIDNIIKQYNSGTNSFFFIQIGSNDGRGDIIYRYVKQYKYHWNGILIEPVRYIFKRLKKTYKSFSGLAFENVAIDNKDGYRTFYWIEKNSEPGNPFWYDQLGTFKKEVIQKHRNEIPNFDKYLIKERVKCLSFSKLLNKHSVYKIDFLCIDTEGYDYELIKLIPFDTLEPKMILYEHKHLSLSDNKQCEKLLEKHGFQLIKTDENMFAYKQDSYQYGL